MPNRTPSPTQLKPRRRSTQRYSVSAVLPAFNEEAAIADAVRQMAAVLAGLSPNFEVIVLNDGSSDRTEEVLARLRRNIEADLLADARVTRLASHRPTTHTPHAA